MGSEMCIRDRVTTEFESTEDVLRAYPDWKLQIQAGSEIDWIAKAETVCVYFKTICYKVLPNDLYIYQGPKQVNNSNILL